MSSIFFYSCLSLSYSLSDEEIVSSEDLYIPQEYSWIQVRPGLSYARYHNSRFPILYTLVRVDLSSPDLSLVCYPMPDDVQDGKVQRIYLSDFSKNNSCEVSFNSSPFESVIDSRTKIVGVHKVHGEIVFDPVQKYAALAFDRNGEEYRACVISSQKADSIALHQNVFGGFYAVLVNGDEVNTSRHSYDSRMAVGIADGGKTIFILACEGEFPEQSRGLSYAQCARIFSRLGCTDAIELDGGTTTALRIGNKSGLSCSTYRRTASCIGFSFAD
ncbi:MAG: phosphodiester glycosidase family protein [Treponema sp.]|nr:phosphodiester glycosidase family protein [Treponema sp.]